LPVVRTRPVVDAALEVEPVDALHRRDRLSGERVDAVDRAGHGAGHRGDGVRVTAERRGRAAGAPRVVGVEEEHRECGGHRLLRREARTDQGDDPVGRHRVAATRDVDAPGDPRGDVGAGHPATAADTGARRGDPECDRGVEADALHARAHHRGDGGGARDRDGGVVADQARLLDRVDQRVDVQDGDRDADGRDAHRRAVGGAVAAGELGRRPLPHGLDRGLRGGAEQIGGTARAGVLLPPVQIVGQPPRVDPAVARDQRVREQQGLLGVVGHVTGRQPVRERMVRRR
jgi:hypothetical protein